MKKKARKTQKQPSRGTLVKKLDKVCSELTKLNWGGKCAMCGNAGTQTHHFFTKGAHGSIRWELDNLCLLDFACHIRRVHQAGETEELRDKLIERIGQKRFDELKKQAYAVRKFGISELQTLLESLELELSKRGGQGA